MLDRESLDLAVDQLRVEGIVVACDQFSYRSIALRHFLPPRTPAPLYASESGKVGTRFVPPNRPIASLYIAGEPETAYREGNQPFFRALDELSTDREMIPPPEEVVLISVHVRASRLLDLRNSAVLERVLTTPDELHAPWKTVADAPTQRLGESLSENGQFEGLIYPSAQHPGGTCLVIFPARLRAGSSLRFRSKTPGVPDALLIRPPA